MLTGQVPGTDVTIGMSRRLFSACRNLAEEDEVDLAYARAERGDLFTVEERLPFDVADEEVEETLRERQEFFAEREASSRPHRLASVRDGFEQGRRSSWSELLRVEPQIDTDPPANLLEAATVDTYIAVNTDTLN